MQIGCAGALLKDVFRRASASSVVADTNSRAIGSLQMFSLANRMLVNGDTLSSLQILSSELHPNSQIWGTSKSTSGAKESLSICGLLHAFASTPQGKTRLRQLILQPATDISLINERQYMIAMLLRPDNADVLKNICASLSKLSDLGKVLLLLQKGVESAGGRGAVDRGAWWMLVKFALNALHLRDAVSQLTPSNTSRLQVMTVERITVGIMKRVGEMINNTIDFEEAKTGSRIAVKWGLDDNLDNLKREYIGLPELLSEVSSAISREVPEWAARYIDGCTFWPKLGFLITVPIDPISGESRYEGQGLAEGPWQQQFVANGMVYYKNQHMTELDECKGDMYGRILGEYLIPEVG
jgi:DNA mismatch repair protein MSH5